VIELAAATAREYLVARGLLREEESAQIEELGWGISNVVLKVARAHDALVVKQSLPRLRVADDWPFDRRRILVERDCLVLLGELLPAGSVPELRDCDAENYVLAMSCAEAGGVLWEEALLQRSIDVRAARLAGELLALLHVRAAADPRVARLFADNSVFWQGRLDPYHRTMLRWHPDLATLVEEEIARMLSCRLTLVHGDYSPKNMFVYADRIFLLDFEVAHLGDPSFDAAFCLTHLVLHAAHVPALAEEYVHLARTFWETYAGALAAVRTAQAGATHGPAAWDLAALEQGTLRELGCLLLARIDGKSKIAYIRDEHERRLVRRLGRELLTGGGARLADCWTQLARSIREPTP
jgi:5-methylthioribose kinase